MKKIIRNTIIILVLCIIAIDIYADENSKFSDKFSSFTTQELVQKGSDFLKLKGKPDSALLCLTVAANRYSSTLSRDEKVQIIGAYNGLWFVYFFHYFDYAKSNEYLSRSMALCDETGYNKARVSLNFGSMYQTIAEQTGDHGLYSKALGYYHNAMVEGNRKGDAQIVLDAFDNIANIAYDIDSLDFVYEPARIVAYMQRLNKDTLQDKFFLYSTLLFNGLKAMRDRNYVQAIDFFSRQLKIVPKNPLDIRYKIQALIKRAEAYSLQGDFLKAVKDMSKIESYGELYDMKDVRLQAYKTLSDYYDQLHRQELATYYLNRYFNLKDTLVNYRQLASVQEIDFLNEIRHLDEQMSKIRESNRVKNIVIGVVAIIAVIVWLFLFLISKKNRRLQESYRMLYQRMQQMLADERHEQPQTEPVVIEKYKGSTLSDDEKSSLTARVHQVLEEHTDEICSTSFSLDRLSELVGANYKHVSQVINEIPETNFNVLVNDYRIREACRRMNDVTTYGNLTIEAMANSVGFRSPNAFRSSFKRVTGLNPSEYMKQARLAQN